MNFRAGEGSAGMRIAAAQAVESLALAESLAAYPCPVVRRHAAALAAKARSILGAAS